MTTFFYECDFTVTLVGVASILGIVFFFKSRRPKNFPPGPQGLPIVGYTPFFGKNGAETLRRMKVKYGPVMSIQMGMEDWVVLNDYEAIYEGLVKQGEKFSGRPSNYMFDLVTEGHGVIFTDYGPAWKTLRKFGLMTLRGFGVGRKGMEENIIEETPYLIESLTNGKDSLGTKLIMSVSNIICRVVFGSRFAYDDKRFLALIKIITNFYGDGMNENLFGILTAAPALRHIPPFRGVVKHTKAIVDEFMGILRMIVEEHKETFNENDIRDFIDAFLKEMKERRGTDSAFCEKQLLQYIRDMFEAGSETTSSTLTWAILAFVNHPEIQERVAKEIEEIIGEDGVPSMKHRDQMPYTCAFIQELMRHSTLVPLDLMHKTNAEATISGYIIPKNTTIIPNLWAVHNEPMLFEDPREFRPERFLSNDGKFVKSKHVIAFSVGPRHCLGEQLARMELFIFLTGIIQKLKVLPDPNHPPPPLNYMVYNLLSTYDPPKFEVKFEKR